MVAKSYQKIGWTGEPFKENGRWYVLLNNGKKARWYSSEEYHKLYPNDPIPEEEAMGEYNFRKGLGFGDRGYVYIFRGDTFPHKDELHAAGARYHSLWGWYIIEGIDVPVIEGIEPIPLYYNDISISDTRLKPETAIQEHADSLIYPLTDTEYAGEVGDRITTEIEVIKSVPLDNQYGGITTIHTMKDWDGHLFLWTTSSKHWEVGEFKNIKGTIKEHKIYHGDRITVLTRCVEI